MIGWLDDLASRLAGGEAVVVVTTVRVEGSGPREAGSRMIVGKSSIFGTIGGGELEWRAMELARVVAERSTGGRVVTNVLGPDLGQCCGGRVTLAFETFAPKDLDWVRQLKAAAQTPEGAGRSLIILKTHEVRRSIVAAPEVGFAAEVSDGTVSLVERIASDRQELWLFGAGHVGRALVRALAPLPFAVTWVDSRQDAIADSEVHGARVLTLPVPDLGVAEAPGGAFYLVMTHSHAIDEDICAAVLARNDFSYLGLIGSSTKKARFASALGARGIDGGALARLHCPIGLDHVAGKDPAMIATSVAADLVVRHQAARQKSDAQKEITASDV